MTKIFETTIKFKAAQSSKEVSSGLVAELVEMGNVRRFLPRLLAMTV